MRLFFSTFLVVFALLASASLSHAAVKALLVGINEYPEQENRLRAPVKDVERMASLLQTKFGCPPSGITRLLDQQATTANVVAAFQRELIDGAGPDDVVVFYFSGHGSYVMDLDGDEPDMRDEALCTYDVDGTLPETWLTDDVLHSLLARVKARHVLIIHDCCHAGSGVRGVKASKQPPTSARKKFMPLNFKGTTAQAASKTETAPLTHHIFLAACAAQQEAQEVPDEKEGAKSLFTAAICKALLAGTPEQTFLDLRKAMVEGVEQPGGKNSEGLERQVPEFTGGFLQSSVKSFLAGTAIAAVNLTQDLDKEPVAGQQGAASQVDFDPRNIPGYTPSGAIRLSLKTDKTHYRAGNLMSVTITADHDCYVRLYNYTADNKVVQLFPNLYRQDHFVHAGVAVVLPGLQGKFNFEMGEPYGNEIIKAVAFTRPFTDEESRKFAADIYNTFEYMPLQRIKLRGIKITGADSKDLRGEALTIYNVTE